MMKNLFFILSASLFLRECWLLASQKKPDFSFGWSILIFQIGLALFFFQTLLPAEFHFDSLGLSLSGSAIIVLVLTLMNSPKTKIPLKALWRFPLLAILLGWALKIYPPFLLWFLSLLVGSWFLKKNKDSFVLSMSLLNEAKYLAFLSAITIHWHLGVAYLFFFLSLWKSYQLLEGFKVKFILQSKEK